MIVPPSQSGFGGYTPAKDAETLGGSEGNYSSKGGDPFSTPGGSGSGIYANAMPETDAAQKYIDEELAYRREHKPSMLRRVLGTAASLYAPGIGQAIMDPGGHEAKFRQNLPIYQAKSKLEQDELTKQATIAQKEEAEANSRAIRDQAQQSALDRQEAGTNLEQVQQMPSSTTLQGPPPLTSPVAPDLMGPPSPEPQGPPVEPQGPPAIPPPSPLAGMYNPTVQTPGGKVPFDPKLSTPVVGGRPAPAGFERRRPTAMGLAAQKAEGEKVTEEPLPDVIADAVGVPRGGRYDDKTTARLLALAEKKGDIKVQHSEAVMDAMKRGVDPSQDPKVRQLQQAITSLEKPPVQSENEQDVQQYLKDNKLPDNFQNRLAARAKIAAAVQPPQRINPDTADLAKNAALDREVQNFSKDHRKSLTDAQAQLDKIAEAKQMVTGNAEAQKLSIPKVLTAVISGPGSGVRITKSEQDNIAHALGISGSLEGWIKEQGRQGALPAEAQRQLTQVLDAVAERLQQKASIANEAIDSMGNAGSREEIIAADKKARDRVRQMETAKTQGGGGTAPIVQQSPSTKAYRYSLDGGKTWQPGQPPK